MKNQLELALQEFGFSSIYGTLTNLVWQPLIQNDGKIR